MNIEFAKSMSGHDRNQYYLIIKKEDEFVYLVNDPTDITIRKAIKIIEKQLNS